jgi:hypothetical protein
MSSFILILVTLPSVVNSHVIMRNGSVRICFLSLVRRQGYEVGSSLRGFPSSDGRDGAGGTWILPFRSFPPRA